MATWRWYLVVGIAVAVGQLALPPGYGQDSVILVAGVAGIAALVHGVRLHRPERRMPWYLMGAGLGLWLLGDLIWGVLEVFLEIDPFPSVADVAYLAAYPLLAVALWQLSTRPGVRRDRSALVDALIVMSCMGLVLWVFFIAPTWAEPTGSMVARLVGVAYPVGDAILLTLLVHLGAAGVARTHSFFLLMGATGLLLVSDLAFQASAYLPALEAGRHLWLNLAWVLLLVLWGAAALHPSMPAVGDAPLPERQPVTVQRVVFLACSVLLLPGLVLAETFAGLPTHTTEVSVAGLLLIAMVLIRMIGMVRRMRAQAHRLAQLADTDFLTGLENARRFTERIDEVVGTEPQAEHPDACSAVLVVAVERFAEINDTLGLRTGDELLRAVGHRLVAAVGDDGVVARLGSDSFGVLLPGVCDGPLPVGHATRLRDSFVAPFTLPELSVSVEVAVGVAVGPQDAATAAGLLSRADVALSAARESPDGVARYAQLMDRGGALTPQLMSELRAAMLADEVLLYFQPQVEIRTGRVVGVEALVRWQHPEHGLLGPAAFVPASERTGLIRPLTRHVLDRALAQAATWRAAGTPLAVSVNLSVRNLLDPDFVDDVHRALERHRLPASMLELEVTETMAMLDPHRSVTVLGALRAMGVTLSVDDYGTGYSSLAYLQRLPVGRLKIDRSFVAGITDDAASAVIVRSTIELARHLGLDVVAEGVEDDETLLALLQMGCSAAQGFGLGRPTPADRVPALVADIEERLPGVLGPHVPAQRAAGPAL